MRRCFWKARAAAAAAKCIHRPLVVQNLLQERSTELGRGSRSVTDPVPVAFRTRDANLRSYMTLSLDGWPFSLTPQYLEFRGVAVRLSKAKEAVRRA